MRKGLFPWKICILILSYSLTNGSQPAKAEEEIEVNAMSLATSIHGQPSVRIVLLKTFDSRGFVFFTNYESDKGKALMSNPLAALCFHWPKMQRQIRIEGQVSKVSEELSDEYFNSRDRGSRIGAWASPQSQAIESRTELEKRIAEVEATFDQMEVFPRPDYWGGFVVEPKKIEFWQGRPSRLHDRILYQRQANGSWKWVGWHPDLQRNQYP